MGGRSSLRAKALPRGFTAFGEVGLAGGVRPATRVMGLPFGAFYVRLEAQAYRLDADNRVWVPGAAITLTGAHTR